MKGESQRKEALNSVYKLTPEPCMWGVYGVVFKWLTETELNCQLRYVCSENTKQDYYKDNDTWTHLAKIQI